MDGTATVAQPTDTDRYLAIEQRVDGAEHDAILARWEFGRELLKERAGKQLPRGRLDEVARAVGKSRREVQYRLQLAVRYPTEAQVRKVLRTCPSWEGVIKSFTVARASEDQADRDEWYTPAVYTDAARIVLGSIDLDPASAEAANEQIGAAQIFTISDDGLTQDWSGNVYLHPPLGEEAPFVRKLVDSYESRAIDAAIVLCPARLDAGWYAPLYDHLLCFCDHRLKLWSPGREPQRSGLMTFVYLGPRDEAFAAEFGAFGPVMRRIG